MSKSYSKNASSVQSGIMNLLKISETYTNFHKKILTTLISLEFSINPVIPIQLLKSNLLIDPQSLKNLISYSTDLLETDILNTKILKSLKNSFSIFSEKINHLSILKKNFTDLKFIVSSSNTYFSESFKKLRFLTENSGNNPKNIKNCLAKIFSPEFLSNKRFTNPESGLIEHLKIEISDSQPVAAKLKKIKLFCNVYKKTLLGVGRDLLGMLYSKEKTGEKGSTVNEDCKVGTKKKIVKNVNRLLNRGSLTIEEAKRMILNLTKDSESFGTVTKPPKIQTEGSPLTETRIKPGNNNLEKALKVSKKINKSCSVFKRRRSTNPSLPRNLSTSLIKQTTTSSKSKLN